MQDDTPEQIELNIKAMLRKDKITQSDIQLANYWIEKWKKLTNWIDEDILLSKKIKIINLVHLFIRFIFVPNLKLI